MPQLSSPMRSKLSTSMEQQVQQDNVSIMLATPDNYPLKILAHLQDTEEEPDSTDFCDLGHLMPTSGGTPAWASHSFGSTSLGAAVPPVIIWTIH